MTAVEFDEIADRVHAVFDEIGFECDFCVQSETVFGGYNRVILDLRRGLIADPSYCSPKFLAAFEAWKQGAPL